MNQITTTENTRVSLAEIERSTRSPALQIMLNPELFDKAKSMASYLSQATGFVPKHLEGNSYACFAVVVQSLTWKMSPYAIANCTYQTPGGKVGYEGKLVHAALENSGQIDGGIKYIHYGDWSKIQGHFKKAVSQRNSEYMTPAWSDADEEGVGVTVVAHIRGEADPRTFDFDLRQAHPRNSTLWATDPKTQICYTAVRRFANVCVPGLFLGVTFDVDDMSVGTGRPYMEINPEARPTRDSVTASRAAVEATGVADVAGVTGEADPEAAEAAARGLDQQAAATINGRMPDTPEERGEVADGEAVPHDEDGVVIEQDASPDADDVDGPVLTVGEWEAEAKMLLKGILKVGSDRKQWAAFLRNGQGRLNRMRRQAPDIWAKMNSHIEQKTKALSNA